MRKACRVKAKIIQFEVNSYLPVTVGRFALRLGEKGKLTREISVITLKPFVKFRYAFKPSRFKSLNSCFIFRWQQSFINVENEHQRLTMSLDNVG